MNSFNSTEILSESSVIRYLFGSYQHPYPGVGSCTVFQQESVGQLGLLKPDESRRVSFTNLKTGPNGLAPPINVVYLHQLFIIVGTTHKRGLSPPTHHRWHHHHSHRCQNTHLPKSHTQSLSPRLPPPAPPSHSPTLAL
uniref:Uncharacterized protein n=1 Tax=Helianthus annuus TaxID=4232 RepID=A0A251T1K9_HELAN